MIEPTPTPAQVTHEDALSALVCAAGKIRDVEALRALGWIAEQIAKGTVQRPAHRRKDHDCVDVFTGFDLAASDVRRAMHSALAMIGLRRFGKGLEP